MVRHILLRCRRAHAVGQQYHWQASGAGTLNQRIKVCHQRIPAGCTKIPETRRPRRAAMSAMIHG
jgi:hypothetical protein